MNLKNKNSKLLVFVVLAIIIIIFVAVLLYKNSTESLSKGKTTYNINVSSTYTIPTSTTFYTTIAPSGNASYGNICSSDWLQPQNYTNNGGGPNGIYLSEQEAKLILGINGTYCATGENNGANVIKYLKEESNYNQIYGALNLTGVWVVSYNKNQSYNIYELIFQSSTPEISFKNYTNSRNFTNATSNGMTYSFYNYTNTIKGIKFTAIFGLKGNYFVSAGVMGNSSESKIAYIISNDLQ